MVAIKCAQAFSCTAFVRQGNIYPLQDLFRTNFKVKGGEPTLSSGETYGPFHSVMQPNTGLCAPHALFPSAPYCGPQEETSHHQLAADMKTELNSLTSWKSQVMTIIYPILRCRIASRANKNNLFVCISTFLWEILQLVWPGKIYKYTGQVKTEKV